jgi:hypothetical protein
MDDNILDVDRVVSDDDDNPGSELWNPPPRGKHCICRY